MLKYNNIIPIFLCFFWMIFPKPVFMILGVSDNVMPLCLGYVRWYAPLFLLTGLGGSLGVILQTSNYTKPLVVYGCVRSGLNIFLDWVLSVRLQECFGMTQTPKVDNGRQRLLMELLSPGFKPIQLTQDLASFWQGTYFEVRKELKRRYPKHYWPENPLESEAVRGVKRK